MSDEKTLKNLLPDAHFEGSGEPLSDDIDADDDELPETPHDVVMMLGFDPKKADFST